MGDRDVADIEADLTKKQRLINAWIAIGPNGKTTDVSEVTDSSRGYASDIRRALEGESDQEITMDEIQEAYHPSLVQAYRSNVGTDAIDGSWPFMSELRRTPPSEPDRSAGSPPAHGTGPGSGAGTEPPPPTTGPPSQSPAKPVSTPGEPQPPAGPGPGAGGPPTAPPQYGPQTTETQPAGGPSQLPTAGQLLERLRALDNTLGTHQRVAQTEINSAPPQSVAQSIAISKYNLVVETRQALGDIRATLSTDR
jgi:hypothetical protein